MYNFETTLKITLATPSPTGKISDHELAFSDAVKVMNETKSASNQKHVTILRVGENEVIISVKSEIELAVPGRAFSGFSRYLIKNSNDNFFRDNIFHGKLLCFQAIEEGDNNEVGLSEEQVLYRLAYLFTKPHKTLSKNEKIMKKKIAEMAEGIVQK